MVFLDVKVSTILFQCGEDLCLAFQRAYLHSRGGAEGFMAGRDDMLSSCITD